MKVLKAIVRCVKIEGFKDNTESKVTFHQKTFDQMLDDVNKGSYLDDLQLYPGTFSDDKHPGLVQFFKTEVANQFEIGKEYTLELKEKS